MQIPEPTIFIVDDNKPICEALFWLLNSSAGLPVAIYHDAQAFLRDYNSSWYGCLLVDVLMPNMNGFELLRALKAHDNQMPVIMLTGHGDISVAVQAMQAGAKDFIIKPFNSGELLEKIQKILSDYKKHWILNQHHIQRFASLTSREREVMNFMIIGKLNKQIAHELGIALKTAELHRSNVMHKLHVKSVAELMTIKHNLKNRAV